ncbi:MAG: PTS sugar transporter subunit IIA [Kiloniellales bacterium]|nr:PTS sugar transporter subunit IIA [Kiloniellales bacterium]
MIGLVLVTHGGLAREFLAAVEHVVGPQEQVALVCIGPEDDMEERRQQIIDGVDRVNGGDGVVVVTDMFGGTPSNLAISVLDQGHVEVIAGMNLPMLIKLASLRSEKPIGVVVAEAREAGRKYINVASELLAGEAAAKVKK